MSTIFDRPPIGDGHCRTGRMPCRDPNCEDEDHFPGDLVDPGVAEPDVYRVQKVPPVSKIVYKSDSRAHTPRCWRHMRWEFVLHSASMPSNANAIDRERSTFGDLTPHLRALNDRLRAEDVAALVGRSRGWLSGIESGHRTPTLDDAIKLLALFDFALVARHMPRSDRSGFRHEERFACSCTAADLVDRVMVPLPDFT